MGWESTGAAGFSSSHRPLTGNAGSGGGAALSTLSLSAGDILNIVVGLGGVATCNNARSTDGGDTTATFGSNMMLVGGGGQGTPRGTKTPGGTASGGIINLAGGFGTAFNSFAPGGNGTACGGIASAGGGSGMNDDNTATRPGGVGGGWFAGNGGIGAPQYPLASAGGDGTAYGGGGGGGGNCTYV